MQGKPLFHLLSLNQIEFDFLSNEMQFDFRFEAIIGPKPKSAIQPKERLGYQLLMWRSEMLALLIKNLQLKLERFVSKPWNLKISVIKSFDKLYIKHGRLKDEKTLFIYSYLQTTNN